MKFRNVKCEAWSFRSFDVLRPAVALILLFGLAACAGTPAKQDGSPSPVTELQAQPAIHSAGRHLECVPYARAESGIQIYGDAWTWWDSAAGHYARASAPRAGAVLAMKVKPGQRGHLAVVREVVGPRTVIADHANWLNRGEIHRNTPIVDVSPYNDWSAVRVWYTPGNHLGGTVYPVQGFIYPDRLAAAR